MAITIGTGLVISGSVSSADVNVIDLSWSGWGRPAIDITTNDSTNAREFVAGALYDPGELAVTVKFDESVASGAALPPMLSNATETWTITPRSGGKAFICDGFVTDLSMGFPHEDANTATWTIKLTSEVTGTWDDA
ncbi:hypothetical protein LCGC14_0714640 [marine sediment metagenome]|uniref:Uncharacterized protein n=1 Tax=marine sediment metagenome TaxID=412755 RepID=A0A0F9QE53_9ZZZZ|nr:hypothetical protein [Phycisphaerae bacterium]